MTQNWSHSFEGQRVLVMFLWKINAAIETRSGFHSNSSNTVVKCSLFSNIRQMTRSNEFHRDGQFLTKQAWNKNQARNEQTNSLELELDLDEKQLGTRTRTRTPQIKSFELELKLDLHKLMTQNLPHSSKGSMRYLLFAVHYLKKFMEFFTIN